MTKETNESYTSSETYENVISSIAGNCAAHIDGIASVSFEAELKTSPIGIAKQKRNKAIVVKIAKEFVTINISINFYYGENIPKTICALQEKIK
ncbi:MAG: Asp23/Gls24 family envelope stress response protein, partial [Clostridia bacterium]